VRHSYITLACNTFIYEPLQNNTQIDRLLRRLMVQFSNPRQQDNEVYNGRDERYSWLAGYLGAGETAVDVILTFATEHNLRALTYGQLVNALVGVNHIRLEYPKLDMCCSILNNVKGSQPGLLDHGMIVLMWESNI